MDGFTGGDEFSILVPFDLSLGIRYLPAKSGFLGDSGFDLLLDCLLFRDSWFGLTVYKINYGGVMLLVTYNVKI